MGAQSVFIEWEEFSLLLKSSNDPGPTGQHALYVVGVGIYSGDKKCHGEKSLV